MIKINTENAPKAIGPYSQAIKIDNLLFVSGQLGINPETSTLLFGIEAQANQAFKNIGEILKASNSSLDNVCKTTIFITDLNNFSLVNEIYSSYFKNNPARSCVEVSKLPKNALIEIEAIAIVK